MKLKITPKDKKKLRKEIRVGFSNMGSADENK
jgi:hypothetical protein